MSFKMSELFARRKSATLAIYNRHPRINFNEFAVEFI